MWRVNALMLKVLPAFVVRGHDEWATAARVCKGLLDCTRVWGSWSKQPFQVRPCFTAGQHTVASNAHAAVCCGEDSPA